MIIWLAAIMQIPAEIGKVQNLNTGDKRPTCKAYDKIKQVETREKRE